MTKPRTEGANLPADKLAELYRTMRLIRDFEESMIKFQKAGELPGPVHLCIGQEAVATGICDHLDDTDYIASTHRGHGHFIAKGGDPALMMAEVFGRVDGICQGKGGSMHAADFSKGILGANGIVAGGVGLATGAAYACQLAGKGQVSVVFFGDGAAAQGVISEALNVASLWKLPLLLVCENNGYSEFSPYNTVNAGEIADRGAAFKVPSIQVDGNDMVTMWRTARTAVERARAGEGPTLIEAQTYRHRGHVEYEDTFLTKPYRSEEEVEAWKAKDPLPRFRDYLVSGELVPSEDLDAIDADTASIIRNAADFARNSPWPEPGDALKHMF
ncbi:MAG: thiamine pyrophosphate-dependent dehydrogenase E1 component subunit alpha [Rhodobiaceae bacterium]|nr:thiamine pyrophosphate-dependent dehydrogenase E1 component subunit alpha [Rhodobiaceae bacterium]MCC0056210.1 thiamine pyrophosphate-dependent dehydrogenase E1 component subunit alpha [Rhodobiaceae bacterium]